MWGSVSPEQKVFSRRPFILAGFALAVALGALAFVTAVGRRTFDGFLASSIARQRAYDVLVALRRVRQDIGEMRVGAAGYALTRDSVYHALYRDGFNRLGEDTSAIRALTADSPSLQRELDQLGAALRVYVADLDGTVRHAEARPTGAAPAGAEAVPARSAMLIEALRPHIVAIETEELRVLETQGRQVQAAARNTTRIFVAVLGVGALVIVGTTALLFAHLRARERAAGQLARAQEQLQQSQRLEAIGQLAGGVAHDFNNVLTVITATCDLLKTQVPRDHPGQEDIELMRDAASQGTDLTRKLLAFGRRQVLDLQVLDLNDVVRRLRSILGRLLPETIDVRVRLAEQVGAVRADRSQVEQVLLNLAVNARDAMPQGGHLTIETMDAELDAAAAVLRPDVQAGRYVALVVSDTGVGMDQVTRQRIFEPFFTTKPTGKGTGLGLATVYGIVKQSGGHIWVYSEPGHGTTFKIYFPRVDQPPTPQRPQAARPAAALTGSETLLLVEDDDQVREVTRRILAEHGYRVLPAARPHAALDILTREAGPVHLLLTDVVLPGMSGPQLARAAQARRPGLRVLYQSGYSDEAVDEHGLVGADARLVPKPFSASTLLTSVREVLDRPPSA